VRLSSDFNPSVLVLREVKNVKYGTFFAPGSRMNVAVEQTAAGEGRFSFKGKGDVGGATTVSSQFTIAGYNLRDRNPAWATRDDELIRALRTQGEWLRGTC
jgi:3-hydroxyacyl-[acyl-carrier-protein] dehydratase